MRAQVPSHSGLPADGTPDTIRMPQVVMWNLPIVHNKSSERWKNVRSTSPMHINPCWLPPLYHAPGTLSVSLPTPGC